MPASRDHNAFRISMLCKLAIWAFAAFYVAAAFVFLTGTFGWFSQPVDPLSGVFLVPLGLPWNLGLNVAPESAKPWLGALAPMLNLGILVMLCRRTGVKQSGK